MIAVTTDVSGTLAAIDGALADYSTSADAMRWAAAPAIPRLSTHQKALARRLAAATGADGYAATFMVADATARPGSSPWRDEMAMVSVGMADDLRAAVTQTFDDFVKRYVRAFQQISAAFGEMGAAMSRSLRPFSRLHLSMRVRAHDADAGKNPRAHRRCSVCHPHAFPAPILGMKPSMPARKAARWNRRRRR